MALLYNMESSVAIPPPVIEDIISGKDKYKKPQLQDGIIDSLKYVIRQECFLNGIIDPKAEEVPPDYKDLVLAFNKGKGICLIQDLKDAKGNSIPLVPGDFSREALIHIRNKYKVLGILSYSPVVINPKKDKAILRFGVTRAGLDAYGSIFFLKKKMDNGKYSLA
ncbi:hypothetical protein [uncultured Croceitalea sp.]|uniref:hypothetical protein n=1 Tax=uncultured Croceitalea sp. TaxID=1798908 RepID=UPI00330673DB